LAGFEALRGRPGARGVWLRNTAALAVLLAFAALWSARRLGQIERAEADAETLRVALVQPNYDVAERRRMRRGPEDVFAVDLVELSRAAQRHFGPIDVFVWPEGAISRDPRAPRNRRLLEFVRESGAEVWTGANEYRDDGSGRKRSYNSAYRIHGDGEVDVRYDKNILVPFGEYMPFEDWFPALRNIQGPGDFAAGDAIAVYDAAGARFAFLICYEAIRSAYVRTGVRQHPDLLVNLTFDAWFGDTSETTQHLMLAAIQSAQYGVPLLRATTTGISASVDARGIVTAQTGVFTREVLVRDIAPVHVPSVYARAGDWFAWSCAAAVAALVVSSRRSRVAPA
jgi:apolipoprotein N-acyltransferase